MLSVNVSYNDNTTTVGMVGIFFELEEIYDFYGLRHSCWCIGGGNFDDVMWIKGGFLKTHREDTQIIKLFDMLIGDQVPNDICLLRGFFS